MNAPASADPVAAKIVDFLTRIGVPVHSGTVSDGVLPGMRIEGGSITIDPARVLYWGDLLHEAGHLAMLPAAERARSAADVSTDPAAEMGAIAWSYAAALHLELDPAVVFHAAGYRGGSHAILENFGEGRNVGVPLLQWMGLAATAESIAQGARPFPHLLRWLRE